MMIDKYPRTFHLKASPCLQNDDKWHGNDNFFINKEVVITEKMEGEIKKPSTYGGPREGFVIRTAGSFTDFSQNVAKYVRAGHVQTDEHWSKNWSPAKFKFHE